MEIGAITKFIEANIVGVVPESEGLYLCIQSDYKLDGYPIVSLVEIREENGQLIADSDSWNTWSPLSVVAKENPDWLWTSKIRFSKSKTK